MPSSGKSLLDEKPLWRESLFDEEPVPWFKPVLDEESLSR